MNLRYEWSCFFSGDICQFAVQFFVTNGFVFFPENATIPRQKRKLRACIWVILFPRERSLTAIYDVVEFLIGNLLTCIPSFRMVTLFIDVTLPIAVTPFIAVIVGDWGCALTST